MKKIIDLFRESRLGVRVFPDEESAEKWLDGQKQESTGMCPYGGSYRLVSKAACDFHKEKKDSECSSCKPINKGRPVNDSILGPYMMMENASVREAADLPVGRYTHNGRGGWKFKERLERAEAKADA